jgi:excisionase family DNA binding protein
MNAVSRLPHFYSIKEAAPLIGVCGKTIRRWIDAGELHVHRLGRQIRISEEDLLAFLAKRRR